MASPRRPGRLWSARSKRRVEELTSAGRMTPAGQAAIDRAVTDGSWSQLDEVDALVAPPDLEAALAASPGARAARITQIVRQLAGEDESR